MISRNITLPELGLIAMTRGALGFGIGLLVAEHMDAPHRRAVGWTLVAVGVASTFPLVANFLGRESKEAGGERGSSRGGRFSREPAATVESP